MGTQTKQIMSVEQRRRRHFSDSFKQSKVHEIEAGLTRNAIFAKHISVQQNSLSLDTKIWQHEKETRT